MVSWTVVNSGRLEVAVDLLYREVQGKQSLAVLRADGHRLTKWE